MKADEDRASSYMLSHLEDVFAEKINAIVRDMCSLNDVFRATPAELGVPQTTWLFVVKRAPHRSAKLCVVQTSAFS